MRHLLLAASATLCLLLPSVAGAQARSIQDCEKIKADLAYNQCLADFGPRMGERAPRGAASAVEPDEDEEPKATRGSGRSGSRAAARSRSGRYAARSGGRLRATFDLRSNRFELAESRSEERRSSRRRRR
ncbi:MAG TPA: hypothetical protein VIL65_18050 [Beijerinckiaceae bacterium]